MKDLHFRKCTLEDKVNFGRHKWYHTKASSKSSHFDYNTNNQLFAIIVKVNFNLG